MSGLCVCVCVCVCVCMCMCMCVCVCVCVCTSMRAHVFKRFALLEKTRFRNFHHGLVFERHRHATLLHGQPQPASGGNGDAHGRENTFYSKRTHSIAREHIL
jgi:hypothetical protein